MAKLSTPDAPTYGIEYRLVPGYDGAYAVGSDGSAWSRKVQGKTQELTKTWQRLKPHTNPGGYLYVDFSGPAARWSLHGLVLSAFVGPCPPGMEARHADDNKKNCRLQNLSYGTPLQNAEDRKQSGVHRQAVREAKGKLTEADIQVIRQRRADGESRKTIAADFDVTPHYVSKITTNEIWQDIGQAPVRAKKFFFDERWDVSHCAGVWVPDKCCREHIAYKAVKKLLPKGVDVAYKSEHNADGTNDDDKLNVITYTLPDGTTKGGFKSFEEAILAAAQKLGVKPTKRATQAAMFEIAVECAEQAVETWNDWLSGNIYGVCVHTYDKDDDDLGKPEECWGHIGNDWAEQALAEAVESTYNHLLKEATSDGPAVP